MVAVILGIPKQHFPQTLKKNDYQRIESNQEKTPLQQKSIANGKKYAADFCMSSGKRKRVTEHHLMDPLGSPKKNPEYLRQNLIERPHMVSEWQEIQKRHSPWDSSNQGSNG
jgi:uncharacterized protein YxeA